MDPTPAEIGGYAIESALGRGGTSTVYLASKAGNPIALKVFHTGAPLLTRLNHPNIVRITDSGTHWLAMEYAPGGDADSELRDGRMSPERAVRITTGIAEALDFAHAHGTVHGDVKPSNFLLTEDDRALLTDFGTPPFVADGVVLTSAAYASPEMLRGLAVDGRSDVYALGCSLFRLLTGKPPFFDAESKDDVVAAHLYREPPRVTLFAPWLPAAMDDVIATAMAKDPNKRFQIARALAAAAAAV